MSNFLIETARERAFSAEREYLKGLQDISRFEHEEVFKNTELASLTIKELDLLENCYIISTIPVTNNNNEEQNCDKVVISFENNNFENISQENEYGNNTVGNNSKIKREEQENIIRDAIRRKESNNIKEKHLSLLKYTVQELVETECDYIKSLHFLYQDFLRPIHKLITQMMRQRDALDVSKKMKNNVKMIHRFGSHFLDELSASGQTYQSIGNVFLKHRTLFNFYAKLSRTWQSYSKLIEAPAISNGIKKIESDLNEALGFSRYIVKPMQRLSKYELLLNSMKKHLEICDNILNNQSIIEACSFINSVLNRCNTIVALESIEGNKVDEKKCGNFILRTNLMLLKYPRKHKIEIKVEMFLFEKVVIIAKELKNSLQYCDDILVANLRNINHPDSLKFTLEDFEGNKKTGHIHNIILEAPNLKEKQKCVHAIDNLLWEQLKRLKEEASTQLAQN